MNSFFLKNTCSSKFLHYYLKFDTLDHFTNFLILNSCRWRLSSASFTSWGNGGQLIFERDLDSLSELLGRPHPEFLGAQLPGPPGGDLQWLVTADLRGSIEAPTSGRIQFSVRENNWLDGLARAMHEALARLCALSINKIQGTRFAHYARRDFMGMPMEMPSHPELRHQVENLDFLLHDRIKWTMPES